MKKLELRQLIREEVRKVVNEGTLSKSITGYGGKVTKALEALEEHLLDLEKHLLDKKLNINELTNLISDIVMESHERGMNDSQKYK